MIGSNAKSKAALDGGYYGAYKPFYTSEESFVLTKDGSKQVFRDKWEAEAMAWRTCKRVERERLDALRLDPKQIKEDPKYYDVRSRLGRFASVDRRLFKQKEAAE